MSQELINQARIKKLWADVEEYSRIIQLAQRNQQWEIAVRAAQAKLLTLEAIEKIYKRSA